MCQFKSGIILKDRVFVTDYDSHEDMLKELGIKDDGKRVDFIRAELVPANGDVFGDISTWEFIVDQDMTPDWYVRDYDKQRMIDAVKAWATTRIYVGVDGLRINEGSGYCLKDCHDVVLMGNSTVKVMQGNSTVETMWGNSTVKAMWGRSTVKVMRGSSTVEAMWDSSTVIVSQFFEKRMNTILMQNSTIKDNRTHTIYQAGDWKLVHVADGQSIGEVEE